MRTAVLSMLVALFSISQCRAALVINGSFEFPELPISGFRGFVNGQVIGNAWTVSSNNSANIITSEAGQGVTPFGRQYLEIHGDSIRQNISGLIPNQAYRLDYFATVQSTAQFFGPGSITASIDGVSSVFNYNLSGIHLWGSSTAIA